MSSVLNIVIFMALSFFLVFFLLFLQNIGMVLFTDKAVRL